jgi:arylsulfatase A-like enzyme
MRAESHPAILGAISTALSVAFLDVTASVLRRPILFFWMGPIQNFILVVSASIVLFFATTQLTYWVLRITRLEQKLSLPTMLAVMIFPALLIFLIFDVKIDKTVPLVPLVFSVFSVIGIVFCAFLVLGYFSPRLGAREKFEALFYLVPVLLGQIAFAAWLNTYHIGAFFSFKSLSANLILGLLFLFILILYFRTSRIWQTRFLIASFLVFIVVFLFFLIPLKKTAVAAVTHGKIKHVILITVDTLRRDALSCYAKSSGHKTPWIDSFASDGIVFENAFSPSSWTIPSMVSIMTGTSPFVHSVIKGTISIPESIPTLADILQKHGYYTAAIGSNVFLARHNISKGFQEFTFFPRASTGSSAGAWFLRWAFPHKFRTDESTARLADRVVRWISQHRDHPFFLWVHFLDPHVPYDPPDQFCRIQPQDSYLRSDHIAIGIREGTYSLSQQQMRRVNELYLGEVRYVDEEFGRIVTTLKELNLYQNALIVLSSDHGEEFWEHHGFEHGHALFNEILMVPMILKLPGKRKIGRVEDRITTSAITPTILNLCGIEIPNQGMVAQPFNLNSSAAGHQNLAAVSNLHYEPKMALIFDHYKFIRYETSGREELFDLSIDPYEKKSLVETNPEKVQEARVEIEKFGAFSNEVRKKFRIRNEMQEFDPEKREQLKGLGYVH